MRYSQKYCLVAFQKPVDVNTEFEMTDWPVHATLADVFAADLSNDLENKVVELLTKEPVVAVAAGQEAVLGQTKVVLLDKSEAIVSLHNHLVDLLEASGAVFNTPEFTRNGFLPHSTIQQSGKIQTGETFTIDIISLVDMFPDGNWQKRRVLNNFALNNNPPRP
jgi:hypothetical protein